MDVTVHDRFQHIPQVPVSQSIAHPGLEYHLGIRPPAHSQETAHTFSICSADATAPLQHTAEEIFWP